MTGFDLSTITGCYVGSTPATAIYYGSAKIWPATQHDYSQDYFTIVSLEDNNSIYFKAYDSSFTRTISASTNGGNTWNNYTSTTNTGTLLATLNTGDKLLLKGNNNQYGNVNYYNSFSSTNLLNVEGNIMSLIYGDNFINQTIFPTNSSYNFEGLFHYNSQLLSAEHLILPVTTLTESCYVMMFNNCSSLTAAPALPATTLANSCYASMFLGCDGLTTAPALPATTLADYCYDNMFQHCTSLTSAPELPAAILTNNCYAGMFAQCSNLQYIKCLATYISATHCLLNWLWDASYVGTFVKDANTTWPSGTSGIPSGWTVQNAA